MKLYNLKDHSETVSFSTAVQQGLGRGQGLFFPSHLPKFSPAEIEALIALNFNERSAKILSAFIGDELSYDDVLDMVNKAFLFPAPVKAVENDISVLELFHGPTLAFKDFGGRFMAQSLVKVAANKKITILTATSGDTGAAVAHAFYKLPNIEVVILYPEGKISPLQEKLFCTLGENIHTVAIKSDFDACQSLVKKAFDDEVLKTEIGLNSANSINISRLLAQICYYFEAFAQLSKAQQKALVVSVPSGNFGNLTAGLLAKTMGLPIKRFIASTNENDTVPRYLNTGKWEPNKTVATLSNAMDVSQPNNWPRIEEIFSYNNESLALLGSGAVTDDEAKKSVQKLEKLGYLSEPHGAIAYHVLKMQLKAGEHGLFLATAHPAKFKESVEAILNHSIDLPQELAQHANKSLLSSYMNDDFLSLREYLLKIRK